MLKKLTLEPDAFGAEDVRKVLAAGVSKTAIRDAMYVAYLFSVYNRLADTLGWEIPSTEASESAAKFLLKIGYR